MARQAIRHEGDKAETLFLANVPSSRDSDDARLGDALVQVDGSWHYVEIKECHSNTINQVRAIKYIPLIIFAPETTPEWVVLPAHELVLLAAAKSRGQHTEIPFECANLSLNSIASKFRCTSSDLEARVATSIRESSAKTDLRDTMTELRSELARLNSSSKAKVREGQARTRSA